MRSEGGRLCIGCGCFVCIAFWDTCWRTFAAVTGARHQVRKCFLLLPLCPVYGLAMLAVLHLPADLRRGFFRLALWRPYGHCRGIRRALSL